MLRLLVGIMIALVITVPSYAAGTGTTNADKIPFEAVVIEVKGMRLKVRTDDGKIYWVTASAQASADKVGQRVRGLARPVGDSIQLTDVTFGANP